MNPKDAHSMDGSLNHPSILVILAVRVVRHMAQCANYYNRLSIGDFLENHRDILIRNMPNIDNLAYCEENFS